MAETLSCGDMCEGKIGKVTLEGLHTLTLNSYRNRTEESLTVANLAPRPVINVSM